ncbi:centrosomal protein of 72 kDa-like [Glandiceps talaboti]
MALTVTEDWIRERVQLKHDNLGDVRSLSLPGTYHEKIGHLGNSLRNFQRIKNLDLSRNALVSLEGLEHLKMLDKLNLYYNNISTLNDLYRLRYNSNLQELDLRLNPVTQNEHDYRLFLVHMLPNLRKLDDRTVRDSERKAALTHFGTDQATDLTEHPALPEPAEERPPNTRAEYVKSIGKKITALDDDDCEVLDLIASTSGDLNKPRQVTGSYAKLPAVDEHPIEDMREMDRAEKLSDDPLAGGDIMPSTKYPPSPLKSSSFRESTPVKNGTANHQSRQIFGNSGKSMFASHQSHRERMKVQFADEVEQIRKEADVNRRYKDESQAYTAYSSKANFTPAPWAVRDHGDGQSSHNPPATHSEIPMISSNKVSSSVSHDKAVDQLERRKEVIVTAPIERSMSPPTRDRVQSYQPNSSKSDVTNDEIVLEADTPQQKQFIERFLTLVDRYWNGSKSLHKNAKFLNQAKTVVANYVSDINESNQSELEKLQGDLAHFAQENVALRGRMSQKNSDSQTKDMKSALEEAQRDMNVLRARLQQSMEESQKLKGQIANVNNGTAMTVSNVSTVDRQIDELNRENEKLRFDIEKCNLQIKHHTQLQELANMLQESHKSLVTTNDHLLKELDETRRRHTEEVKQLHLSYGELKQTMDWTRRHGSHGNMMSNSGYERYNDVE